MGTGWRGNLCLDKAGLPAQTYRIHAHSAIFNIYDGQVPQQHAGQIMAWFQEIERVLMYRRIKRCTGRAIHWLDQAVWVPDQHIRTLGLATQLSGTKCRGAYKLQGLPDSIDTINVISMVVFSPSPL
jgi:hypothetical protein